MTTFGNWFEAQAGRGDPVGEVARAWRDAKGDRPRASAVATITRWLQADPDKVPSVPADQLEQVLVAAATEYRTGNHQAGPAVAALPNAPVTALPGAGGHQQPGQPAEPSAQDQVLVRLLTMVTELHTAVGAQGELLASLLEWAAALREQLGPLVALLAAVDADPGPAPADSSLAGQLGITAAQEAAVAVAQANGWLAGPTGDGAADVAAMQQQAAQAADPQIPGNVLEPGPGYTQLSHAPRFYAPGTIVPEPDFGALDAVAQPEPGE